MTWNWNDHLLAAWGWWGSETADKKWCHLSCHCWQHILACSSQTSTRVASEDDGFRCFEQLCCSMGRDKAQSLKSNPISSRLTALFEPKNVQLIVVYWLIWVYLCSLGGLLKFQVRQCVKQPETMVSKWFQSGKFIFKHTWIVRTSIDGLTKAHGTVSMRCVVVEIERSVEHNGKIVHCSIEKERIELWNL